ncbi:GD16347 [Drosophila simulans]|uniref:GD16347 n=1 Tax=Drosophila simulans TaxID=7240 RepID=B4R3V3_DROSI|nr:GD16347 [Drosophila simulans]
MSAMGDSVDCSTSRASVTAETEAIWPKAISRHMPTTTNLVMQQQTSVEEIPLLLYSANEGSSAGHSAGNAGRRFVAAAPAQRRRQQFYN